MKARSVADGVEWVGAVDWDRRLFDSLIPLPDGTSYNAYLVRGSGKTALIDTVDPAMAGLLFGHLAEVPRLDYVIINHVEQDHSGTLPALLERYPEAVVVTGQKGKGMIVDHLRVPGERIQVVPDGSTLSLGDRTLRFVYTPWVHWPETMSTLLEEQGILFSCDFFGSHLAASDLFVADEGVVYQAAKRYFAEIMMPFRQVVAADLTKLESLDIRIIAPSHGPLHRRPAFIVDAYRDWVSDLPKNEVVVAYVTMHGSTAALVNHLVPALAERGVRVRQFNLADTDLGTLAISLVDAATIVIGTPAVHVGPHPAAAHVAFLANALRPKARFASVVGSFGWGARIAEQLAGLMPNLKVELLDPVICRGFPRETDFQAIEALAATIAAKHKEL